MNVLRINDGDGLYDDVGLCNTLLKIIDHIEVKGSANIENMLIVMRGLEKLEKRLREIRDEKDKAMEAANGNSNPSVGAKV